MTTYPILRKPAVKISNTTAIATGLAVADQVIVAWQTDDLNLIPLEYASCLANEMGIALPDSTPTTSTSSPTNTSADPFKPSIPSTGAKASTAVGAVLGAVIVIVVTLCLRQRRNAVPVTRVSNIVEMEDPDRVLQERKWFFGWIWKSEVVGEPTRNELDSKTTHVVSGPAAEL
jgi:hypothetical protein